MLVREAVELLDEEHDSVALSEDSLGGGVGGFSMGVKPRASDRLRSRRICGSERLAWSAFTRDPETVDIRLGINIGSGL